MISTIRKEMILVGGDFALRVFDYLDSLDGFDDYVEIPTGEGGFIEGIRRDNHLVSYSIGFSHSHQKDVRVDGKVASEKIFRVGDEERRSYHLFSFSEKCFDEFALNGGHPCYDEAKKVVAAIYSDGLPSEFSSNQE
tara:strand:- start:795 stop:1205 length:411 start_codon:yes stop_codon:yes gene_type:complete